MKKIATFALLAGVSVLASAQSSVTLFGVLDVNLRDVKNGDVSLKSLSAGGINTSRLGFRGTEDLGGGLKAGLRLESRTNPDTRTTPETTRFGNRRSTVDLDSGHRGEGRL